MFFSKTIAIAIMATVAGANAAAAPPMPQREPVQVRPAAPVRPVAPQFNMQTINCGGGASPFCCSPSTSNAVTSGLVADAGEQSGGSTCARMSGSSVQCNAIVVCCNNNGIKDSTQSCSGTISQLQKPVTIKM